MDGIPFIKVNAVNARIMNNLFISKGLTGSQLYTPDQNYIYEFVYYTDLPKCIELGDAIEQNPYHLFFYMIARFYFLDSGDNEITYYYPNKYNTYLSESALSALPSRFHRLLEKKEGIEYIQLPGCNWMIDSSGDSWIYTYIRDLYKDIWKKAPQDPKKFTYISRSNMAGRKVLNEGPDFFKKLKAAGFSVYRMEDLTFEDQIKLFSSSKILCGAHGAAFAFSIFCQENAILFELYPSMRNKGHYYDIALKLKPKIHFARFSGIISFDENENMRLNEDQFFLGLEHYKQIA